MTTIKNVGKFSFDELCNALEFDQENDFSFTAIKEDQVVQVAFNDFFSVKKSSGSFSENKGVTTIAVTEENIEISLGQSVTQNDEKRNKLFSAIETVLADYVFRALYRYCEKENNGFGMERVLGTYTFDHTNEVRSLAQ